MKMRKAAVEVDLEKLAPFRPPALVTLYIALLKAGQMTCLLGSVALTLHYFKLTGNLETGWLLLVIFLTHLASFYRRLWTEEHFIPDSFFAKLGEFILMIAGLRLVLLAFGQASPLITLDFMLYALFMTAAWYAGLTFLHQYYNLYLQPYEVSEEEGGVPALGDAYHLSYDHTMAYRELKSHFMYMGLAQVVVTVGGVSMANQFDAHPGKADLIQTLVILGGLYLLSGIPFLVWARMRYLRTLWQLAKLAEPARLAGRWVYYLGGLLVLALVVSLAIYSLGGVAVLPLPTGGNNQDVLPPFFNPPTPAPRPTPPPLVPPRPGQTTPPPDLAWLGVLFQTLVLVGAAALALAVLLYALGKLIQAGWVGPQWRKMLPGELWRSLLGLWRGLFLTKRPKDPFEKASGQDKGRFDPFGWLQRDRLPDDRRGQVRFYYRQVARRAGRAGLPRRASQTPAEYARYLAPNLEEAPYQAHLDDLTGLYQEARFSPHPLEQPQVETARDASQSLVAYFRQRSRRARIKPPFGE